MNAYEAIKRIEDHKELHKINEQRAILIDEALIEASKALTKQIPIKPYQHLCDGCYICPSCHRSEYISAEPLATYCSFCGQKLDKSGCEARYFVRRGGD